MSSNAGSATTGRYLVGAYAASPSEAEQDEWFEALGELPGFAGLEMAHHDGLRPFGDAAVLSRLRAEWDLVLTAVPCATSRSRTDAAYGLASTDPQGRAAAQADTRALLDCVRRIHDTLGRAAVIGVELQTAPNRAIGQGTAAALADSLVEIASWGWGSTRVVVEHCDALVPEHPSEKGFLRLAEEIEAVTAANERAGADIGLCVNWGRSVLEGRRAATAEEHIAAAAGAGLLAAVMFSGVSEDRTAYGAAWSDSHLPVSTAAPESLLTPDAVRASLAAAGRAPLDFCGVKMCAQPADADVAARIAILRDALGALESAGRGESGA